MRILHTWLRPIVAHVLDTAVGSPRGCRPPSPPVTWRNRTSNNDVKYVMLSPPVSPSTLKESATLQASFNLLSEKAMEPSMDINYLHGGKRSKPDELGNEQIICNHLIDQKEKMECRGKDNILLPVRVESPPMQTENLPPDQ